MQLLLNNWLRNSIQIIKYFKNNFFSFLYILVFAYLIDVYIFSYNYEIAIVQYDFIFISGLLSFLFIIYVFFTKKKKNSYFIFLTISICHFIVLLNTGNEQLSVLFSIASLLGYGYFIWDEKAIEKIIAGLNIIFIVELILGYQQFELNDPLAISGTLQNSGIYSCYLVISLPFLFYRIHTSKLNLFVKTSLLILLLSLIIIILIKTKSRTAIIAVLISFFFYLFYHFKNNQRIPKLKYLLLFFSSIISISLVFLFLIRIKIDSINGRLLGWEIIKDHLFDHPLTGYGMGKFERLYPAWQAEYFANRHGIYDDKYFRASETYIILNEYLQIIMEVGFLGFGLFCSALLIFLKSKAYHNILLIYCSKVVVILFLFFAVFSYPLHTNVFIYFSFQF